MKAKGVNIKRNPVSALQLSLDNAKNFYRKLCEFTEKIDAIEKDPRRLLKKDPDEWKETVLLRKALWIALIIEVGRLFDTFEDESKKVISFKKVFKGSSLQTEIDAIHGEVIISKILRTRNTFTAHIGEEQNDVLLAPEICKSNLGELLDRLDAPLEMFTLWFTQNRKWRQL